MCSKQIRYEEKIKNSRFFMKILDYLMIDKKYIGYYYIVEILNCLINCGMPEKSMSKIIYPVVGLKFEKNSFTIERDIRHLINKSWNDEFKFKIKDIWEKDEKPTCRKFIFILRDYIYNKIA